MPRKHMERISIVKTNSIIFVDSFQFITKDDDSDRGFRQEGKEAYQYHEGHKCAVFRENWIVLTIFGKMTDYKMIY